MLSASVRLSRSATLRNLLWRFLTSETADLHLLSAWVEQSFGSNSKSFSNFSILSLSKWQSLTKLSFSFFTARYSEERWFREVLVLKWVVWQAWKEIPGVNGKSSYISRRWFLRWRLQMDGYFTLAHVLSIHWRNRARKARTDNQWHDMKNVFRFTPRFLRCGFLCNPN